MAQRLPSSVEEIWKNIVHEVTKCVLDDSPNDGVLANHLGRHAENEYRDYVASASGMHQRKQVKVFWKLLGINFSPSTNFVEYVQLKVPYLLNAWRATQSDQTQLQKSFIDQIKSNQQEILSQNRDGHTELHLAARDNRLAEVEKMLDTAKELDVMEILVNKADDVGNNPLSIATKYGHSSIVQVLLQNNAKMGGGDWFTRAIDEAVGKVPSAHSRKGDGMYGDG